MGFNIYRAIVAIELSGRMLNQRQLVRLPVVWICNGQQLAICQTKTLNLIYSFKINLKPINFAYTDMLADQIK